MAVEGVALKPGQAVGREPLEGAERRRQVRRAMIASTVGGTIEWYDFFLYSTVTGLVFAKLYFPQSDPFTGTLQAFGVYAVGFIARPVGGFLFGHYGDRIGRKATLISTLLLMGLATCAVAFVPTYSHIGIWGAVILTLLRFIQGVGVGGEWSGGVLLALEWAPKKSRGLAAAWPQFGSPAGLLLANLAVLAVSWWSGDQFLVWGWRVPFILSALLIGVGLYIRLGVEETPAFASLVETRQVEKAPIVEVLRSHWKTVIFVVLTRMGEITSYYLFTAYIFAYGTDQLHIPRNVLLAAVMVAASVSFFTIPYMGHLSDRFGRKRIVLIGAVLTAIMAFVYFAMIGTREPWLVILATTLALIPHDMMWGPLGAFISENFPPKVRYSGGSIGGQLAAVISGGPAPLIATALAAQFHTGYAVSAYIAFCAVLSIIGAALLRDNSRNPSPEA